MSVFIRCLFGPRLYKFYRHGNQQSAVYQGNIFESICDQLIKTAFVSLSVMYSISFYTSPLIAAYMYRSGYVTTDNFYYIVRMTGAASILLFGAFCLRGIGRMMNADYLTFLSIFDKYSTSMTASLKEELSHFEFDFRDHPVEFRWDDHPRDLNSRKYLEAVNFSGQSLVERLVDIPQSIASYVAMHCFGRLLIYPGSVKLLHLILSPVLMQGRAKAIEDHGGKRYKLLSLESNHIDCLFIDRRNRSNNAKGETLVVCCEGNSGFYEIGITGTPIAAGYSVLGWNHPGFYDSTGLPYPDQETNAIDVVMQFAIHKLGFPVENIVIYAWSIGGYTSTWAAMNYPNIKGLILDATFDSLVPLAVARMPAAIVALVNRTIVEHMNLNVAAQLCRYPGPVVLIRRAKDEMISTDSTQSIRTNRGNDLLQKLLENRYPNVVTEQTKWALTEWMSADKNGRSALWQQQDINERACEKFLESYVFKHSKKFPMMIGEETSEEFLTQFLLFLADKHMFDFESTHCIPLPPQLFHLPSERWNSSIDAD